jgi:hypothetical protein
MWEEYITQHVRDEKRKSPLGALRGQPMTPVSRSGLWTHSAEFPIITLTTLSAGSSSFRATQTHRRENFVSVDTEHSGHLYTKQMVARTHPRWSLKTD